MSDQKSYTMTLKGKKIASCTFAKKLGAWRLWSEKTGYVAVEAGIAPKTAWEAFRKEVTTALNVTVKRGRPPKYTEAEKAAKLAEKEAAKAKKKAEREAAKAAKPAKAKKAVAVATTESMAARGQRELIAA